MFQTILDIIYPVRCPICSNIVISTEQGICKDCGDKLIYISEPRCKWCSKPIEDDEKEYCNDCERKTFHYDKGYALWVYNDAMKNSIAAFKYRSKKEYSRFYIKEIVRVYGDWLRKLDPDAIIPVPIHRSKYLQRGYNQADLLAKGIGNELGIPVLSKFLIRNRKTLPQKKLSDKERLRNLSEAFEVNDDHKDNRLIQRSRILLVDDIYTTGSTVEACSSILKAQGIKEVYFIVLCIGNGY